MTHTEFANNLLSITQGAELIQPLLDRGAITGATLITHGFQVGDLDGDSLSPLANAVRERAGGWLFDYDIRFGAEGPVEGFDRLDSTLPIDAGAPSEGELVLLFDWSAASNEVSAGWGEAAGDALFNLLVTLGLVDPTRAGEPAIRLHFIAYSFGSGVTSEAVERLAFYNITVDQVTLLDPHDFNQDLIVDGDSGQRLFDLGQPAKYGATIWSNVTFADVYYETRVSNSGAGKLNPNLVPLGPIRLIYEALGYVVPGGRPIPGAYNLLLAEGGLLPRNSSILGPYPLGDLAGDNGYIWNSFYLATVLGHWPDGRPVPELEAAFTTTEFLRNTGYALSRVADPRNFAVGPSSPYRIPDGSLATVLPLRAQDQFRPNFYAKSNGQWVQHHRWTEPYLLETDSNGRILVGGALLTPDQIARSRWAPQWNPFLIHNGTFTFGAAVLDTDPATADAGNIPSWSYHGGAFALDPRE